MSTMPVSSRLQGSKTRSAKSVKSRKLSQCYCGGGVHEDIRWRNFEKTIVSKSLSVILHLLADNIIAAVLKRRSTAVLLGSVELALTKALAIKG